jgi:hypothetical protein
MKKPVFLATLMLAAVIAGLAWWLIRIDRPADLDGTFDIERPVHWRIEVRNTSSQALENVSVASFIPVPASWQQQLVELEGDYPVELFTDNERHPFARITIDSIPPFGQRDIRLRARLAMAGNGKVDSARPSEDWLSPEPLVESDHPEVARLADDLLHADPLAATRAIYDWLLGKIEYTGYDPVDRGALHALTHRQGDCTEYASLAVALARAMGLPARLAGGYIVPESGRIQFHSFHAWAEIRVDDRWLILDAQRQQFDPQPFDYVVTHYGARQARNMAWDRFFTTESRIKLSMQ